MVSEYERKKQENIQKNKELLASLGLDKPLFEPIAKSTQKTKEIKKRKTSPLSDQSEPEEPAHKRPGTDYTSTSSSGGPRRSARQAAKIVDYTKELRDGLPRSAALAIKAYENEGPQGQGARRTQNPKTYGHIPGIEVGTWWLSRRECSNDAIHAPWVGGIATGPQGAYSVTLSGGYEDDVDLGYALHVVSPLERDMTNHLVHSTFTGSGGRDLKGTDDKPKNLRTGPQSFDQSFEHNFNKALLRSSETKKPVRVVRGFKVNSKYAPYEGYRYDGLYQVEKAWEEKGDNTKGYIVCKFAFKRLLHQPPLPIRGDWNEDANGDANETEA